jgi:hypothetical protein
MRQRHQLPCLAIKLRAAAALNAFAAMTVAVRLRAREQVVLLLETEEKIAPEWLLASHRKAGVTAIRRLWQEVQEVRGAVGLVVVFDL